MLVGTIQVSTSVWPAMVSHPPSAKKFDSTWIVRTVYIDAEYFLKSQLSILAYGFAKYAQFSKTKKIVKIKLDIQKRLRIKDLGKNSTPMY